MTALETRSPLVGWTNPHAATHAPGGTDDLSGSYIPSALKDVSNGIPVLTGSVLPRKYQQYATTTLDGTIVLTGDLGGTATSPTVPGLATKVPTTRTVTAGTGLSGGGDLSANRTLAVVYGSAAATAVQGNDTRVLADQAAATASIRTLGTGALQAAAGSHTHSDVPTTRQIIAGTGLSGGGDLTADRTLAVVYGTAAGTAAQGNDSRITSAVPSSRQVLAGAGLSGGGALTGDVTLAVAYGSAAGTAAQGNDARLSDARVPTAHAASHGIAGADRITPAAIGALLALVPTGTKTAAYTAALGELVMVDASAGPVVITLPSTAVGGFVGVKKIDTSVNVVTVAAASGNTIGSAAATSVPLRTPDQSGVYQANGTAWIIERSHLSLASLDARYPATTDPRLSDSRVPTAHAASHNVGGTDDLSGYYVPWVNVGVNGGVPAYNDARLSNARAWSLYTPGTETIGQAPVWNGLAYVPGPAAAASVAAPGASPGSVLNDGPRSGQNHFSVQLARLGDAAFFARSCTDIAAGYEESPLFYVPDAAKQWVACRAYVGAPTTGGSSYARAELREQTEAGIDMGFDATDANTHRLQGRFRIVKAPSPGTADIVCAQLHNGAADRVAIRTQVVSGTWRLRIRWNGSTVTLDAGGTDIATGIANIQGLDWDFKIEVVAGIAKVYVGLATDPTALTVAKYTASAAFTATAGVTTWYFKTGCYLQTNVADGATSTDYGEVWVGRQLQHWHTGWATPAPYYQAGLHGPTHQAGGYDPIVRTVTTTPKTANYTLTDADDVVEFDTTSGPLTATLPTPVGRAGKSFVVKKAGPAVPNALTIATAAGSIDGLPSEVISVSAGFRELISTGSKWAIIGGSIVPVIVTLTSVAAGGSIAIDASIGSIYRVPVSGATASLAVPTQPIDGDVINVEVQNTSGVAHVLTINGSILLTTALTATINIPIGKRAFLGLRYLNGVGWFLLAATVQQ